MVEGDDPSRLVEFLAYFSLDPRIPFESPFCECPTIAVDAGEMRASTSAALVGAAILSTMVFPLVGLHLREGRVEGDLEDLPADDPDALPPGTPLPIPA